MGAHRRTTSRWLRLPFVVAVGMTAITATASAQTPGATDDPAPTLAADPDQDLVDGQTVTVSGSGFESPWLTVWQCTPQPAWETCRVAGDVHVSGGSFTTDVTLLARVRTFDDSGMSRFDCRTSADPCRLVVGTGDPGAGSAVSLPLHFDPDGDLLPPPVISVDPAVGLADGDTVAVSGTGFTPQSSVEVSLCRAGDDVARRPCNPDAARWIPVDDAGTFTTTLVVTASHEGPDGFFDCRGASGCIIAAHDWSEDSEVTAPITFAGDASPPTGRRYLDPVFDDVNITRDVVYRQTTTHGGTPIDLKLDIYRPAGDTVTNRPAMIWMHGGHFTFGTKDDHVVGYAMAYARRGYVAISLQYRLRPNMPYDDTEQLVVAAAEAQQDATAAVEWLQAHAGDYGIDPDTIIVGGYSAGGVIAWNLAYLPRHDGISTSLVAAAVPIAGLPFDAATTGAPPVISFHAVDDTTVPIGTAKASCARAAEVSAICRFVEYRRGDHGIVWNRFPDVLAKSTFFLANRVLAPRGYLDVMADAGGPYEVTEGSTITLDGTGSTGDGLTYAWSPAERVDDPSSPTPALEGIDEGTETLTLTIVDDRGISVTDTTRVTTLNAEPTIEHVDVNIDPAECTAVLVAAISDPGVLDTHFARVDWGDGTVADADVNQGRGTATVRAEHTMSATGERHVTLIVIDDAGATVRDTRTVDVSCATSPGPAPSPILPTTR